MRTHFLAALGLVLSVAPPETLRWERLDAAAGQVRGTALAATRDALGNLYVVGTVVNDADEDLLLLKYASAGSLDRSFGRGGYWTWDGGFGDDRGTGVAVDGSGAVYVSGYSSNGANDDAILLKYDAAGQPDPSFGSVSIDSGGSDHAQGVAVDAAGRAILAGFAGNDVLVRRYSPSGALDAPFDILPGRADAVDIDAVGNVYVAGQSGNDTLLLKYSAAGSLIASQTYNNFYASPARAVAVTPAGDVAIAGQTANGLDLDVLVLKYTASLDLAWAQLHDSGLDEDGTGVAFGPAGEIYVSAWSSDFLIGGWNEDALLLKYTAAGALAFTRTYDAGQRDRGYGVVPDGSGGAILVGGTRLDILSLNDVLVARYSSTGALSATWSKTGYESGHAVAFGPDGATYVAGQRWNGADFDAFTTKIRPDGTTDPVFGTRLFSGGVDEIGTAIAVDAAGNAYVGVSASLWGMSTGIAILKYTAAGTLDTGFSAAFSFSNQDGVGAVGLSPDGRVVVVGNRANDGTGYAELLVLRLDPATGAQESLQTYANPAGGVYGAGVAFDAGGRIYASGTSNDDVLLVRLLPNGEFDPSFAAATYDGGGADWGGTVAVDGAGGAAVVGSVWVAGDYDLIVLRFDSLGILDPSFADGGVYTYATGRFDFGNAIALETDGSLVVAGETDSTFGLVTGDLLILKLTPDGALDPSFDGDGIAIRDSGLGRDAAFALATGNGFAVAGTRGQAELWVMRFAPPDPVTNGEAQDSPTVPAGGGCAASIPGTSISILGWGMLAAILLIGSLRRVV